MVVAIGIDEIIQFYPEGEFDVGVLDAEDKRRLLALGSTSSIQSSSCCNRELEFPLKYNENVTEETNNNICKDEREGYSLNQKCGKIRSLLSFLIWFYISKILGYNRMSGNY